MRRSVATLTTGLNAGLELGHAETSSFICAVIALHLVRNSCKLLGLDIRIELDVHRALTVPIPPLLAWRVFLLACWSA